jgi:hypothetical protein
MENTRKLVQPNCKSFFQIKTFHSNHNCGCHYHNKRTSIPWAANRYLDSFRDNRDLKPKALREMIKRDYHVGMKLLSCHREKRKALQILDGIGGEQYKHTREYANASLHWNQGSSAYIQRDGVFFQRMYVSLASCKQGFLAGYRLMICVDACFLKGKWGGHACSNCKGCK